MIFVRMPVPTQQDLKLAREAFLENEPRDLFYRVATELIQLSIEGKTQINLPEALAVLLQTWNRSYYQFRPFDNEHFEKIDRLIDKHIRSMAEYRKRTLLSLCKEDQDRILEIFGEFEGVLAPVGASKSLHLLAPRFFPLWDRAISASYGVALGPVGTNAILYYRFMHIVRVQWEGLKDVLPTETNPLKAIDEYNYCHYTKGWI